MMNILIRSLVLNIVIIFIFLVLVKSEYQEYNETSHTYTYNCKELYHQKQRLEEQIYRNHNVRYLYKEISQMIYQLCYKNEL